MIESNLAQAPSSSAGYERVNVMNPDVTSNYKPICEDIERDVSFTAFLTRFLNESCGGSLTELSRRVGISRPTLMKWLSNPKTQPELPNLKRVAEVSKVNFIYLVRITFPENAYDFDASSYEPEVAEAHRRLDSLPKRDRALLSQVILNYQPR